MKKGTDKPLAALHLERLDVEFRNAVACLGESDCLAEWATLRACSCGYDSVHVRESCRLVCAHCGHEGDGLSWSEAIENWNDGLPESETPILILD